MMLTLKAYTQSHINIIIKIMFNKTISEKSVLFFSLLFGIVECHVGKISL